ncbi:F510_1955 family glycosylhydrolase [Geodermatophilus sp. FMUSA9-8]|uniref:F510_1955 family glycosylhydrolase n=1 Tax=Geodermatophilus sp. FMUSA9-8 TaxID=3120155 RepID=UPI00300A1F21
MTSSPHLTRRRPAVALAAAAVLGLSACSSDGDATRLATDSHDAAATDLPSAHVHGVAVNPADELVYLATHDGLFRYDDGGPTRIGPVIDLMGFTVAGPDHFYASGHPGPGVDLPEPVGLIESTDGGETWQLLSRQGESDFHALTASRSGVVVGFDGRALSTTTDGATWRDLSTSVTPHALAGSEDAAVLVATHESGPLRSVDGGATWEPVADAPLLQVVDWAAGQTVVGVTPDGTVAVSTDAGATWEEQARVSGSPQAVGANATAEGALRVLVVTSGGVHDSTDGGETFAPLA